MSESHESAGSWPTSLLQTSLALDSDGSHAARARRLAAAFLTRMKDDHGIAVMTATVEIVQLIVSELVTNARKYAPGPALLHLRISGDTLQIELWDTNPVAPVTGTPDPRRIGGHGLEIVTALAQSITIEATPPGKRIVATVALAKA